MPSESITTSSTPPSGVPAAHDPAPRSRQAFERAARSLVGGVNSPVRAYSAVGGIPRTVARGDGPIIEDIDGNRFIDLVGSWGPTILGHAHPDVVEAVRRATLDGLSFGAPCEAETNLAELILSAFPTGQRIRFVNSGTEACMSAIRLARAVTGRRNILKFEGNYHGHTDSMLVAAGSGANTLGVPNSAGVPAELTVHTHLARYNDLDTVDHALRRSADDLAAIIVEPAAGNMGLALPEPGFLEGLRDRCDRAGALLIFDEVMTGFRVAWGGHQSNARVSPDITCLGKVIGGGLPAAAYMAPETIMRFVAPLGPMYQAGTLSGNPLAMAAGLATLTRCALPGFYEALGERAAQLAASLRHAADNAGVPAQTTSLGGMVGLAFSSTPIRNNDDAHACDHDAFRVFFHAMLDRGVWLPPSPYEAMFMSAAHTAEHVDQIVDAASESFAIVARSH